MKEKIKENGGEELTIFFVLFFFLCLFLRSPPAQFLFFDPFLFCFSFALSKGASLYQ